MNISDGLSRLLMRASSIGRGAVMSIAIIDGKIFFAVMTPFQSIFHIPIFPE